MDDFTDSCGDSLYSGFYPVFSNADQDENGLLPVRRGDYGVMGSYSAIYQCKAEIIKKIIKKSCMMQDFLV